MKTNCSFLFTLLFLQAPLRSEPLPKITLDQKTVGALGITSAPVTPQRVVDPVTASSRLGLDPTRSRSVATFFSGQIDRDLVQPGQKVVAGQALTVLKSRDVAEVLSRWLEADSKLASTSRLYEREQDLRPRQLTTEDDLLKARAAFQEARVRHTAAWQKALFARSKKELEDMRQNDRLPNLTELTLTAPIAGTIVRKSAYPGDALEANSEVLEIADLSTLLLEIDVPLRAANFLKVGDPVDFHTVIGQPREAIARVERLEAIVDRQALTVRAFARLENPKGDWIAGTPVQVDLYDSEIEPAPAVPRTAVIEVDGDPHVFITKGPGEFQPAPVVVGRKSEFLVEVTSNIPDGAQIVITGANLLLAAWEDLNNQ